MLDILFKPVTNKDILIKFFLNNDMISLNKGAEVLLRKIFEKNGFTNRSVVAIRIEIESPSTLEKIQEYYNQKYISLVSEDVNFRNLILLKQVIENRDIHSNGLGNIMGWYSNVELESGLAKGVLCAYKSVITCSDSPLVLEDVIRIDFFTELETVGPGVGVFEFS